MAATFRDTGIGSARAFFLHWKEFCTVALVGTFLLTFIHVLAAWQVERSYDSLVDQEAIADDMEMLEILRDEQRSGNTDPELEDEMRIVRTRIAARMQALAGYSTGRTSLEILIIVIDALLTILITIIMLTWVLIRLANPLDSASRIASVVRKNFSRMAQIIANIFFFSLLWIPGLAVIFIRLRGEALQGPFATVQTVLIFVGYLVAVLLVPRIALAPVLATHEPLGPFSSLLSSYERSRGYWAKILGTLLGITAIVLALSLLISMFAANVFGHQTIALLFIHSFLLMTGMTWIALFLSATGESVLAHPLAGREEGGGKK